MAIALTSPTVSVRALPRPPLTGPADLLKPGATVSRLAPVDSMLEVIELVLPVPMASKVMTEAMPMTMPRTVSPDLTLFAEIARNASVNMSPSFMPASPPARAR